MKTFKRILAIILTVVIMGSMCAISSITTFAVTENPYFDGTGVQLSFGNLIMEYNKEFTAYRYIGYSDPTAERIEIPAYLNDKPVIAIRDSAFRYNFTVKSIVLPNTINNIGTSVFEGCSALTEITIPDNVVCLPDNTFNECKSLKTINLSKNLKTIGQRCFMNNPVLESAILPEGLETLGNFAYYNCPNIKNVFIPNSVVSAGQKIFFKSYKIETLYMPDIFTDLSSFTFNNNTALRTVRLSDNISIIEENVFSGCTALQSINIPANLKEINNRAFENCTSLTSDMVLPNSLTYIGSYIFMNCPKITKITIGTGVKEIDASFYLCTGLKEIVIPDTLNSVTSRAFYGCTNLEKAYIPKAVTVGVDAFTKCGKLTIYGYNGSAAQTYANTNTIPFIAIDGVNKTILANTIQKAKVILTTNSGKYLPSSISALQKEYDNAVRVYNSVFSTSKNVEDANTQLNAAITNLKVAIMGDINGDGKVTLKDVTYIQRYVTTSIKLTQDQMFVADVTHDGTVTLQDAVKIQSFVIELITSLD